MISDPPPSGAPAINLAACFLRPAACPQEYRQRFRGPGHSAGNWPEVPLRCLRHMKTSRLHCPSGCQTTCGSSPKNAPGRPTHKMAPKTCSIFTYLTSRNKADPEHRTNKLPDWTTPVKSTRYSVDFSCSITTKKERSDYKGCQGSFCSPSRQQRDSGEKVSFGAILECLHITHRLGVRYGDRLFARRQPQRLGIA